MGNDEPRGIAKAREQKGPAAGRAGSFFWHSVKGGSWVSVTFEETHQEGQQLRSPLPPPCRAGRESANLCLLSVAAACSHCRALAELRGWGLAVAGGDRVLPCAVPRHPLASQAVTLAAAPRPARLLHAETHTPKSPWVRLLGSSHQLLFPSVPKPSEELVENKEVSGQGALSQSAAGLGSRGRWWRALSSVPSQEGCAAPLL